MNPDIHLALHHTRAAELRAEAGAPRPLRTRQAHRLRARLGWTLVEVGLRLATRPAAAH
ncbi:MULTISPECIES: hypothetical protein [Streptomyces]|uniref:Transcriptional regulator n=1 Tax=Streptomyces koelreuteriae TaxID=2838015 RepID=A0ABX8FW11_9ACTN|nr:MULTISPECIES: hypothetical protein [Streptomyces]QWB25271.1 hypothetical protein KJK29_23375 [Streptomyces koelreuteriae]UUA08309.1 hypothetical protein NNW98_23520 [Streptomyces koelreuteriae]UUA15915.1 hypothetical protein NNW99_23405 [Streptomyces sp. CRCS-T-1]